LLCKTIRLYPVHQVQPVQPGQSSRKKEEQDAGPTAINSLQRSRMPDFTDHRLDVVLWSTLKFLCFFIPSSLAADSAFKDTGHETARGTRMYKAHVQWHMFIGFHIRDNITILCDDCATSLESAWLADALQIGDSSDSLTINGL